MTHTRQVSNNVFRLPNMFRRRPKEPEGDMELRVTYEVYHMMHPLSVQSRERVIRHVKEIFNSEADYNFED
jgi:hypothetical protein